MGKHLFKSAIALVALTATLAGCGTAASSTPATTPDKPQAAATPVDITFWHAMSGVNGKMLDELVAKFNDSHPAIHVKAVAQGNYGALNQKEVAALAAGSPPTMAQAYENWVDQYLQSDAVVNLDPFVNGKDGMKADEIADFLPRIWDTGLLHGKRYLIPFTKSDVLLFYNKERFDAAGLQPPATWDDFVKDAQALTKGKDQWGISWSAEASHYFPMATSYGAQMFDTLPPTKATFDTPEGITPVKLLKQMVDGGAMHLVASADVQADFAAGRSAMMLNSSAGRGYIGDAVGSKFKLAVAKLPAGPKGQITDLYGAPLIIFKKATPEQQAAAWTFSKWLLQPDQIAVWSLKTGYLPLRKSVLENADVKAYYAAHPDQMAAIDQLAGATTEPPVTAWNGGRDSIQRAITAVLTGQKDPDTAMKDAAAEVTKGIAK